MHRTNTFRLSFLALSAALNLIGGTIALALRLPIYLDSLGTMLSAALFGPFYGMLPGLASGLISGFTSDSYALYYIPVQLLLGLLTGLLFRRGTPSGWRLFPAAALLSLPGTIVGSAITAVVFGGITSSGSTLLVQLLHSMGLSLTLSVSLVQAVTDYADRALVLFAALTVLSAIPKAFRNAHDEGGSRHGSL